MKTSLLKEEAQGRVDLSGGILWQPLAVIRHRFTAEREVIPETLKQLSLKVSQYFLDFLESDFKRQQAPRRRVILQTSSGFKAGIALAGYRSLMQSLSHHEAGAQTAHA